MAQEIERAAPDQVLENLAIRDAGIQSPAKILERRELASRLALFDRQLHRPLPPLNCPLANQCSGLAGAPAGIPPMAPAEPAAGTDS